MNAVSEVMLVCCFGCAAVISEPSEVYLTWSLLALVALVEILLMLLSGGVLPWAGRHTPSSDGWSNSVGG